MGSDSEHADSGAVDDLRASVGRVSLEVQALADRVQELVAAVESLAPRRATAPVAPASPSPVEGELVVSVSPLPELAMAAVAETALRGLSVVRKVVSVERSNAQATFVLEVDEGGELIAEMRRAMPVPITVDTAPDGSLNVVLEWAWGRSTTSAG
ncbi:MAG: hypothetical protein KDB54_02670 [Solirubrobacterales bacterium]|nr:hypothetical protein [Solirubrobacterales bacterium]MCB0859533.1 hypothetical protein [Solirubrobacterales bacterium]HRV59198.1 hypothetical protein [Solirubrobacterales bacterium]